jgi:hypothetical protein
VDHRPHDPAAPHNTSIHRVCAQETAEASASWPIKLLKPACAGFSNSSSQPTLASQTPAASVSWLRKLLKPAWAG